MNRIQAREIDRTAYADFLAHVPHSAFQRLAWLEQVERLYPVRLLTLGHFDRDDLIAVTPLMRRRIGPFVLYGSPLRKVPVPPATSFCAPVSRWREAWAGMQDWFARMRLHYLQLTLPEQANDARPDEVRMEILENLELPLNPSIEQLWRGLSQLPRRCVRKAVKQGVKVHWRYASDILDEQTDLLHGTYARQGVAPNFPLELYREIFFDRAALGLRILCATHGGRSVAVIWVFRDQRRCYYWDAAARDEGRRVNASHLLVWCLIRWAKNRGFDTLDFVGAGRGRRNDRPGIGRFKRSMGTQVVSRHIVYKYSPPLRFSLHAYRVLIRLHLLGSKLLRRKS